MLSSSGVRSLRCSYSESKFLNWKWTYPAASLGQGDIFHLRDEHLGVQTVALQSLVDLTCYISIIGELAEQSIRTPLSGGVYAVAIIE